MSENVRFGGEEMFDPPIGVVYARLTDLAFLAQCIPDLQRVERVDEAGLVCRVRPGFSFLSGELKLDLEVLDKTPERAVRMRIRGKGIGSSVDVVTEFELSEDTAHGCTRMRWNVEVEHLGGLLKPLGQSLIEAAAKKVVNDGWAKFRKRLSE